MPWNRASRLVERADEFSYNGNYEGAERLIAEALSLAPNLAGAYATQAMNHLRQERIVSAHSSINTALTLDPNDLYVRYTAGLIATARNDYREAEAHFREGISLDSEYIHNFTGLAELFQTKGNLQKALSVIDEAKVIDPENVPVAITRANILVYLGRLKEAAVEAKLAMSLDPEEINCSIMMSEIEFLLGNITAAREHAVYALMKNPRYLYAKIALARVLTSEYLPLRIWWHVAHILRGLPIFARYIAVAVGGGAPILLGAILDSGNITLRHIGHVAMTVYVAAFIFGFAGYLINEWLIDRALKDAEISKKF